MKSGHGNDIFQQKNKVIADFSTNVLPVGAPHDLLEHLQNEITQIQVYPDPHAQKLTQLIANSHRVSASNVLVTNGANEAFYLLAQLMQGKHSLVFSPSYAEYADACRVNRHRLTFASLTSIGTKQNYQVDMVWLGNPNNPTGRVLPVSLLLEMLQNNLDTLFMVDEAYADCSAGFQSMDEYIHKLKNLVVVRSLTKQFGIPGLRLGYVLAHADTILRLSQLQIPWSVNRMAQVAGEFIFSRKQYIELSLFCAEAQTMCKQLRAIDGVEAYPGNCNFFLARLQKHSATELKSYLMENHGFLIRDASNFEGLDSGYFRVAAQLPEKNKQLVKAIHHFLISQ